MSRPFLLRTSGVLRALWAVLDGARRALLNLALLALVAAALWLAWSNRTPALEPATTLVLELSGPLVEQTTSRDLGRAALRELGGPRTSAQTRLRDLVAVLDAAAADAKVTQALLLLDDFGGAGLPALREAGAALERFKAAGKKVFAWGSGFDQRQYHLAAHASELWLDPMGMVYIEGFGRYRNYYRDALDRLGVSANVVRAGKFKNAAEAFAANAPSPETLESEGALWASLWRTYTGDVERARRLEPGAVTRAIDGLPRTLPAAGGDAAKVALDQRLVDALMTRPQMRALLAERGARDEKNKTFRQIGLGRYLGRVNEAAGDDVVAVIVAQGEIGEGRAAPGRIGGLSTADLIRRTREDEHARALVLRVNSPGGSAFGSELVRRELELTRQAGKPVVVSMGDVAASGGYWISLAADEVIADEATITGSIGVVGLLPTAKGALDRLGVHTGGTTTTWLGGAYDPRRELDPRFGVLVQTVVDRVYDQFLALAASQRKTSVAAIDAVAQGRVWSGAQAHEHGLVDRLGGFDDAVQAAARRAGLSGKPRLRYVEVEPGRWQRWVQRLTTSIGEATGWAFEAPLGVPLTLTPALVADAVQELGWLLDVTTRREPFAAVTHCLCGAP